MSAKDFLKFGFKVLGGFRESTKIFMSGKRTVCIKYTDGRYIEHANISEPWRYIAKVKKSMEIKDAWIKDE